MVRVNTLKKWPCCPAGFRSVSQVGGRGDGGMVRLHADTPDYLSGP